MKRIVLILSALMCLSLWNASAQYALPEEYASEHFKRIGNRLAVHGKQISWDAQDDILQGMGLQDEWSKGMHLRSWGLGSWITGTAMFVGGGAMVLIYSAGAIIGIIFAAPIGGQSAADNVMDEMGPYINTGLGIQLGGLAMVAAGVTLHVIGASSLKKTVKAVNTYGRPVDLDVTFGPTASGGLGLAMNF